MKLKQLLNNIDCKVYGKTNVNITSLQHIAQNATKGSIFFCLNGKVSSGEDWAADAIKNGCKVIVTQSSINVSKSVTQIIVKDSRIAMSQIAANFYGNPADKLNIIGVTGTNGKTTTTNMIAHVLSQKYNVGIIGTLGAKYCGKTVDTGFTTPDPIILQQIFADMVNSGVQYVVMEMSAHAIYLNKLYGINPYVVAFTNLSQDHLDYFENMENYYQAKKQLFTSGLYKHAIVCTDSAYGKQLAADCPNCVTCNTTGCDANIKATLIEHNIGGQKFNLECKAGLRQFDIRLLGNFNLQNVCVAIGCLLACNLSLTEIANSMQNMQGVPGRFESYYNGKSTIIVDYAHTPDGLKNLLVTARKVAGKGKLICVFGCGGNRDTDKRPQMAAIAEALSDYVIVTNDNPRFEDSYKIAQDICKGFNKNKHTVLLDRTQAVYKAVSLCKAGDIVVLAGKGAEEYMDISGKKIDFSDKLLAEAALKETNFLA